MASELTLSGLTIAFAKTGSATFPSLAVSSISPTVAGAQWMDTQQSIATSDTTIVMGDATGAGWMFIQNLDGTNYVEFKPAAAGTVTAKILAGEWMVLRLGSGASAPVLIANTAACNVRIIHFDA